LAINRSIQQFEQADAGSALLASQLPRIPSAGKLTGNGRRALLVPDRQAAAAQGREGDFPSNGLSAGNISGRLIVTAKGIRPRPASSLSGC